MLCEVIRFRDEDVTKDRHLRPVAATDDQLRLAQRLLRSTAIWVDPMSFRPFTSESYAQDDRPEAWRDVLAAVGLQPATGHSFFDGHATASHRHAAGVALTRMAAGPQTIGPRSQANEDLPIALMPVEDGMVLKSAGGHRIVPAGHLVLLRRSGGRSIAFQRDMRSIVLSVPSEALPGRLSGRPRLGEPRVVPP